MDLLVGDICKINDTNNLILIVENKGNTYKSLDLVTEKENLEFYVAIKQEDLLNKVLGDNQKLFVDISSFSKLNSINISKIDSLSERKLDKVLRAIVKYTSKIYYDSNKRKISKNKQPKNYIAPAGKVIDEKELYNMIDSSLDMWLTTGRFNDQFEKKLSEFMGLKYISTTNSGSSANLLAITTLTSPKLGERRLIEGDEVITVAAGFPTTIAPIIINKLIPVFVDIDLNSYNINVSQIEESITDRTKAIVIAHTLGIPYDLTPILDLCKKYNLWLVEDNCDALGSKYNGQLTGTFGDISTLSFYPAHHITMGEGGAVMTNNKLLNDIIISFRDWGRDCWCKTGVSNTCGNRFDFKLGNLPFGHDHKYIYSHIGYNLKITDWQASIALAQLDKLPFFIEKRRKNFSKLKSNLFKFSEYLILPEELENIEPAWFGFIITVKENNKFNKNDIVQFLENNLVGTRQFFAGNILRQPMFLDTNINLRIRTSKLISSNNISEEHYHLLPNTDYVMKNTFWIGLWPGVTDENIDYIIKIFEDFFNCQQ